jgi:hypothetical protein
MESFVYTATVFSTVVMALLLVANLLIIMARITKNDEAAHKIVRFLLPFASFLRVPGRNPIDQVLGSEKK